MSIHTLRAIGPFLIAFIGAAHAAQIQPPPSVMPNASQDGHAKLVERGRYLVKIAGCNDCHTPGYALSGGKVPEKDWLIGDQVGWQGPWGTTYPANLRLSMQKLDEAQWLQLAHSAQFRPPMPWFALRDMTRDDLRAIYQFVRDLDPAGDAAPSYAPPGEQAQGPYILFPKAPQ